jgi:hypothetical protein
MIRRSDENRRRFSRQFSHDTVDKIEGEGSRQCTYSPFTMYRYFYP